MELLCSAECEENDLSRDINPKKCFFSRKGLRPAQRIFHEMAPWVAVPEQQKHAVGRCHFINFA